MGYKASNNADTTLSESITPTSTTISVATGHGDDFPTLGASDWTLITITDKNGAREIIKIIARTGDTMTVGTTPGGEADVGGRAQEGTAALSITYTDDHSVRCCPTAGLIEAMADYSDQGDLTATPAEIEAVCKGNTATAAELSQLHESGVVKADLEKLHDITSSATEINQLHGSGVVKSDFNKLHAITTSATLIDAAADLLDPANRAIGDIITETSAGTMGAIAAAAVGNYLKSAGVGAIPQWGKLRLEDTGVAVGYLSITASSMTDIVITTGFRPSAMFFLAPAHHTTTWACLSVGFSNGSKDHCAYMIIGANHYEVREAFASCFYIRNPADDGLRAGKVVSRSSTGFTLRQTPGGVLLSTNLIYCALP
jgi:hypothetical protein